MWVSAHIPKSYLDTVTASILCLGEKQTPSCTGHGPTHICLIYPWEVEILPQRWNHLRSPPLFPVKAEPFVSRQTERVSSQRPQHPLHSRLAQGKEEGLCVTPKRIFLLPASHHSWLLQPVVHQCVLSRGKLPLAKVVVARWKRLIDTVVSSVFIWMLSLQEPLPSYSWERCKQKPVPAENNSACVLCGVCLIFLLLFTPNIKLDCLSALRL